MADEKPVPRGQPVAGAFKARNERHLTVDPTPFRKILASLDLEDLNIVEFGIGTGNLTRLILEHPVRKLIGYEIDPSGLAPSVANDPRFELRRTDLAKDDYDYMREGDWVVIANAPYSLLGFIKDAIITPYAPEGAILFTSQIKARYFPDFNIAAGLTDTAFEPPGHRVGAHLIIMKGFENRRKSQPAHEDRYVVHPAPPSTDLDIKSLSERCILDNRLVVQHQFCLRYVQDFSHLVPSHEYGFLIFFTGRDKKRTII